MSKFLIVLFAVFLTACSGESTSTVPKPTGDEINGLKLAYIQLEQGTVSCDTKIIDQWSFAACSFISLDGKSAPQIWYYDNQKDKVKRFYAFTGNARGKYSARLKVNALLGDYADAFGLPIPKNMDMTKILESFQ